LGGAVRLLGCVLLGVWVGLVLAAYVAIHDPLKTGKGTHPAPLAAPAQPFQPTP